MLGSCWEPSSSGWPKQAQKREANKSKTNDEKIDKWDRNFSVIQKEVSAFIDVSNPKTIRLYTTELRKILDDVTLLNKIVENLLKRNLKYGLCN